eukprot:5177615-Amphidinium_carterae.1
MLAVRQRLKHRACADAIGWTQCVMSQVLGREQAVPVVTAHLRRYSTGLMGNHSSSVLQSSLQIPLYKNAKGNIRPIAVATVWRKLQGSLALLAWGDAAASALGGHQHGIQQEDGAAQFALKIARRA